MPSILERGRRAWNAFMNRDPTNAYASSGYGSSSRPDRVTLSRNNARSIVNTIYNRIAVDVGRVNIVHATVDDELRYKETRKSGLNDILTYSANIDQTGRALIHDIVISMFDEGCVAVIPTDTDVNPELTSSYEIYSARTGKIVEWFPDRVRVRLYREATGRQEDILLPKSCVAIIENPFYSIMNEPNSTLQRLVRVLNQIDRTNAQNSSGKLDMLVRLPFKVKTEAQRKLATARRQEIEDQLMGSQYGIAYVDAMEQVTQLNRPIENNLWTQAQDLTFQLFNQLGLTQSIFDGTADEQTMLNYYDRTIEPILTAITEEMTRKWITKTGYTQGQRVLFFRDPFKLVPVSKMAEIADKFTRNEIMSSNEIRSVIGMKPSDDPKADELRNSNLNHPDEEGKTNVNVEEIVDESK